MSCVAIPTDWWKSGFILPFEEGILQIQPILISVLVTVAWMEWFPAIFPPGLVRWNSRQSQGTFLRSGESQMVREGAACWPDLKRNPTNYGQRMFKVRLSIWVIGFLQILSCPWEHFYQSQSRKSHKAHSLEWQADRITSLQNLLNESKGFGSSEKTSQASGFLIHVTPMPPFLHSISLPSKEKRNIFNVDC